MNEIITQTIFPTKGYCKYKNTLCEFANDRGYCVKTGCSKSIIRTEEDKPAANENVDHWGYPRLFCPECGVQYIKGQRFCVNCGHKLI